MTVNFLFFLLLLLAGPQAAKTGGKETEAVPTPAKPSVEISFERLNIRENDTIRLELIVINDADYALTNTSLQVNSPAFLEWQVVSCNGKGLVPPAKLSSVAVALGPVEARTSSRCTLQVVTKSDIGVGEFNSLFILGYQRQIGKFSESSLVTTEKTLKANLLGSESVAGVPLVLAGFIVPGLVFWIVVSFFGVSWKREGLGDQMIYSVLVSLVLVTAETWIGYVDFNTGISTGKLFRLGLGGLIAGLIAGGIDLAVRLIRKNRVLRDQINEGDDELTILAKLLKLPAHSTVAQPMIELKGGARYVGSLGARTEMVRKDSAEKVALYSLVGSWAIKQPAEGTDLRKELDNLRQDGKIRRLIETAKKNNLIEPVDSLQTVAADDTLSSSAIWGRSWKADDVTAITPNVAGWSSPPLDFK